MRKKNRNKIEKKTKHTRSQKSNEMTLEEEANILLTLLRNRKEHTRKYFGNIA